METIEELANMFMGVVDSSTDSKRGVELGGRTDLSRSDYDDLRKLVSVGSVGERVVSGAKVLIDNKITDCKFCWDYCFLCYYLGSAKIGSSDWDKHGPYIDMKSASDLDKRTRAKFSNESSWAGVDKLKLCKAGTWIYINNHNSSDISGNHSLIVMSDYSGEGLMSVSSLWNSHEVPHLHTINPNADGGRVVGIFQPSSGDESWYKYGGKVRGF